MTMPDLQMLSLIFLTSLSIGGVAWVFLYPLLSGERHLERRRESVARTAPVSRVGNVRSVQKSRREQVEETLKQIDVRSQRRKRPPLKVRIDQAGLSWSNQRFIVTAAVLGIFGFIAALIGELGVLVAAGVGFAASFGVPLWILSYLKRRREAKFLDSFPDAVDVIVRGIKAGLPLLDSLKMIAAEAPEPARTEFKSIVETQTIGIPLGEACTKLYERMPVPEANFFGIVVSVQQKSGGNLSEALGNLSRVLRDRKRMQAKIKAMSMEAKASATIIGSLPIVVGILVYLTSPDYISLLWTHSLGQAMMAGCAMWMGLGVLVMKNMINFDF